MSVSEEEAKKLKAQQKSKKKREKQKAKKQDWQAQQQQFFDWLQEHGVTETSHVKIAEFKDTGRGMQATRNIEKGETLFSVPESLLMSVRTAASSSLAPVFKKLPKITADDKLVLHILFEKHSPESPWQPYLRMLPKQYTNSIFFNQNELQELQGSNLYVLTQRLMQQVESDYQALFPALFQKFPKLFNAQQYTLEEYKWGLATVWRVLPPFADMFNHHPTADTNHSFDPQTRSLRCVSNTTSYKSTDQVFIFYGPFPNHKLLRLYGFSVLNNPHDNVELYASMTPDAPNYPAKLELLQQHGIQNDRPFELQLQQLPPHLLTALRIQRLEPIQLINTEHLHDVIKNNKEVSRENEALVTASLTLGLQQMLQQYPTTIQQDEQLLSNTGSALSFHVRCAVILRLGEKKILESSIEELRKR